MSICTATITIYFYSPDTIFLNNQFVNTMSISNNLFAASTIMSIVTKYKMGAYQPRMCHLPMRNRLLKFNWKQLHKQKWIRKMSMLSVSSSLIDRVINWKTTKQIGSYKKQAILPQNDAWLLFQINLTYHCFPSNGPFGAIHYLHLHPLGWWWLSVPIPSCFRLHFTIMRIQSFNRTRKLQNMQLHISIYLCGQSHNAVAV
jgi:hypothetical protein